MPNHVYSEITLFNVPLEIAAAKILNAEGKVDFSVLLPLPINFWPGSVGQRHKQAFPGTYLDAATATWGTKWNAYGDPTLTFEDHCSIIRCRTAWSSPRGWICALFNTLKCNITVEWLDEGREPGFEEIWLQSDDRQMGSPSWHTNTIPAGTAGHRRLHKCLWGVEEFEAEEE